MPAAAASIRSNAPEYEFLDGRGQWTERGDLGATGSVVLRPKGAGQQEITDLYGNSRIAFAAAGEGTLLAYDPDGKPLGKLETTSPRAGWRQFKTLAGARSYVFDPAK